MRCIFLLLLFCFSYQLVAQEIYHEDRHNTSYNTGWMSCFEANNPNPSRGNGHWIMYDLRNEYALHNLHFWNLNAPPELMDGVKDVVIDLSMDGQSWSEAGKMTLLQAPGSAFYQGQSGPDLGGSNARYVLLTAVSNYGGDCFGLSEVKINLQQSSLPVTLVDQYLKCQDGEILVSWEVEQEYQNDFYTVETSNNLENWTVVSNIKGENHNEKNTYQTTINSVATTYVRIKQQDMDGASTYFPAMKADCQNQDLEVSLYPNPAVDHAIISYQPLGGSDILIQVANIDGKLIQEYRIPSSKERIQQRIDLRPFPSGTYNISITDNQRRYQETLIKM